MNFFNDLFTKRRGGIKLYTEYAWKALQNSYRYPKRAYHNWDHIEDCMKELSILQSSGISFTGEDLATLALLYHDCIYNPRENDNEERSAERALLDILALGFNNLYAIKVYDFIILTKHDKLSDDFAGKVVMDCDLAILGKDTQQFKDYETKIRMEYGYVPECDYRKARIRFLKMVLEKEYIYHTEFFRNKYEKKARSNIMGSIERLLNKSTLSINSIH